ncbi:BTE_HP_G0004870.mRNA.1.CDS.1 [Saccharomyces cerevisiae]|nr:BTE_HP_G0004870.mRNA.1.CDS.1 [Saccharomyces cerevisiae]CAI6988031.1 BTE_HP_G0004870.mRNA.1.CDS.1 [Saccharomyces cerevisiae]
MRKTQEFYLRLFCSTQPEFGFGRMKTVERQSTKVPLGYWFEPWCRRLLELMSEVCTPKFWFTRCPCC